MLARQVQLKYSRNVYPGISKYTFNCTENLLCEIVSTFADWLTVYDLNLCAAWRISVVMPGKCFWPKISFSSFSHKETLIIHILICNWKCNFHWKCHVMFALLLTAMCKGYCIFWLYQLFLLCTGKKALKWLKKIKNNKKWINGFLFAFWP